MYKAKFTLSDDTAEFEGFTDGSLWNGWSNVFFTREQVEKFLSDTPYGFKFLEANTPANARDYPVLVIYFEDEETIESTPFVDDKGNIVEGYCFEGFEFMEVGNEA